MVALIRGGVPRAGGVWADLGAGTGNFTWALAELIGPQGMERLRAFRKIANQHVGFVICDKDMTIVAIVDAYERAEADPGGRTPR